MTKPPGIFSAFHGGGRWRGISVCASARQGSIESTLGVSESALQRGGCVQQSVTSRNLFLCRGGIGDVGRIADAGSILFGPNRRLKFRCLAVVFRDLSFGLRDVDQCLPGRPLVGIRTIVRNSLFNVLSMCLRARQAFLQDGDQAKGYARVLVLRAKLLSSLRLQRDLALDLGDCRLCRFALCLPGVHPTPCLKPFRLNASAVPQRMQADDPWHWRRDRTPRALEPEHEASNARQRVTVNRPNVDCAVRLAPGRWRS